MHQNRVDPFGNLIKTKARGSWLGNRGQLHGRGKMILKPFKHRAWIICLLAFKGRRRETMAPNLWTELFFLDEATALAAGHRPCFECRREDATRFKAAWIKGNPSFKFDRQTSIGKIDEVLHAERIDANGKKVTFEAKIAELPNGTFVEIADEPYLVVNGLVYLWTPFGYGEGRFSPSGENLAVLTPRSVVEAIKVGYQPQLSL